MFAPRSLFHCYRQSRRLIQTVAAAFVLSLGVAIAAPALQTNTGSPDSQLICLGNGGMKTVTFAADGTTTESPLAHNATCLLCSAVLALQVENCLGIEFLPAQELVWANPLDAFESTFERLSPPARAPPQPV
jgi:hypothetical protein